MAELTITTLNALVKEKPITKGFVEQVYTYTPILNHFKEGKAMYTVKGGNRIMASIQFGNLVGKNWTGSGVVVDPTTLTRPAIASEAWYDWAFYNNASIIPYKEWLLVQKGAYTLKDYAKMILKKLAESTARDFEGKFFNAWNSSATIPNKVFGLSQLIHAVDGLKDANDNSTPIYVGDVKISELPEWKSQVDAYDTTKSLILNLMHSVNTVTHKWGKPTLILTSQAIYEEYCEDAYDKSGYLVKDEIATKLGFSVGASFNGIPFVFSEDTALNGNIYMFNNNYLKFVVHPDANFKLSPWTQVSTTNYDYIALEDTTYSMIVSNRAALVKITGVT